MADDVPTTAWHDRAWRLPPNRVSRFYRGGLLLDRFRGSAEPADTDRPEDWVGSATRTWSRPGTRPTDEGLSNAEVEGRTRRVAEVLADDPEGVAGPDLASAGPATGILVKLLDAGIRLPVHAHPTRAFAREHLGSSFGKAEAWIVLGTRTIPGAPPPHVRLGFRRAVGRDELRRWIEEQQTTALLEAMVHRSTVAGDVWFVPPATPHAIGAGVFILEVQEPTDFSIVLETADFPIDPGDASLGLGWDVMLDAIDRGERDDAAVEELHSSLDHGLPRGAEPYFWARRITVEDRRPLELPQRFVVGVVVAGSGTVETPAATLAVVAGDTFAIPAAAVADASLAGDERLELILAGSAGAPSR